MPVNEVGTLAKGEACAVCFPDRKSWLCRVASSLHDEALGSVIYECITPHGSVVVAGAVWVRPLASEEFSTLLHTENAAKKAGVTLYRGKISA